MGFAPLVRNPLPMDPRIFRPEIMGLYDAFLELPLESRFVYDAEQNLFFVNFEGLSVRTMDQVNRIGENVRERLSHAPGRAYAIVNYDNFTISPELIEPYVEMVKGLIRDVYSGVTRYTTSAFLRMKLGDALGDEKNSANIYGSAEEAREHLRQMEKKHSAE
jgi:propionate CoA-transferase